MAKFRPNLGQFWSIMVFIRVKCGFLLPKIVFFDFEKKKSNFFFKIFLTKNIAGPLHSPNGIRQSPIFGQFLAKMAKTVKIIKKALGTFLSRLQALTNCKVSEKSNERFPRKSVAHTRTYGRTHRRDS